MVYELLRIYMNNHPTHIHPIQKSSSMFVGVIVMVVAVFFIMSTSVSAQISTKPEYSDPTSSSFRIVVCDGPSLPNALREKESAELGRPYVACDFNGIMLQIKHLINIMMVLGVFASIGAFSWAGALYISGSPEKKKKAHAIFPKIFTGFIVMLSAWFIVYQILSWLTDNQGFKTLLGNP